MKNQEKAKNQHASKSRKNSSPRKQRQSQYVPAAGSQTLHHFNQKQVAGLESQAAAPGSASITQSKPSAPTKKRKVEEAVEEGYTFVTKKKSRKVSAIHDQSQTAQEGFPQGLIWDKVNYSCAYDSLFTILKHCYDQATVSDKYTLINESNPFLQSFCIQLHALKQGAIPVENVRDDIRDLLNKEDPNEFPRLGSTGTDINSLCMTMLQNLLPRLYRVSTCHTCHKTRKGLALPLVFLQPNMKPPSGKKLQLTGISVSKWLAVALSNSEKMTCVSCQNKNLQEALHLQNTPQFLAIATDHEMKIKPQWEHQITLCGENYSLKGLIYLGSFHFTCRIIDKTGRVWYHDGIRTGKHCQFEGKLSEFTAKKWAKVKNKKCCMALYGKEKL